MSDKVWDGGRVWNAKVEAKFKGKMKSGGGSKGKWKRSEPTTMQDLIAQYNQSYEERKGIRFVDSRTESVIYDSNKVAKMRKKLQKKEENLLSGMRREIALEAVETKVKKKMLNARGRVVLLSHIPEGFTDYTLKSYFEQFGTVLAAKLCMSERTGRSRGFAVIEFLHPEVAKIAANTMNNYVLKKRLLKAKVVVDKMNYIKKLLNTKVHVGDNPGLERRKKYIDIFNRSCVRIRWSKLREKRLKKKGTLYTYKDGEDAARKYIDRQLCDMKAMKSKQIPTEDQEKQDSTEDQNKQVPLENQNKKVSPKNRKKRISSKDKKKKVLAKHKNKDLTEDQNKQIPLENQNNVSSKDKKQLISSNNKKKRVLAKHQKKILTEDQNKQVPLENQNKSVSSKDRKKLISSNNKKKQVLAKHQKKVLTKVPKKLIPSCLKPAKPVLEVDESDEEIEFKTPPNTIKRRFSSFKPR